MLRLTRLFSLVFCLLFVIAGCQWVIVPIPLSDTAPTSAPKPALALEPAFLFDVQIELEAPRDIGSIPELGIRHLYYFKGGSIVGPGIQGEVLAGGENWFLIRNNRVCDLFIQGQLRTTDGALIAFAGHAYSRTTPEVRQSIFDGAPINTDDYPLRGVPFFETDAPQYDWLNHAVTVATYRLEPDQVTFSVYAIR